MMINGTTQEIRFQVEPEDAKIYVNGKEIHGKTIELSRKEEHRYRIEHPELGETSGMIEYNVDLAPILLDIFLTCYIGLIVDLSHRGVEQVRKRCHRGEGLGFQEALGLHEIRRFGGEPRSAPRRTPPVDSGQRAGGPGQRGGTPGGAKPPGDFGAVKQPVYRDDGQRWALVVGISEYEDGSIPKIPNARRRRQGGAGLPGQPEGRRIPRGSRLPAHEL